MKNKFVKACLFFVCLICYYFFFWEEKFGLNLFIFNVLLIIFLYVDFKAENKLNKTFLSLICANLITSISVLILNTDLSKLAYFISLVMVVGLTIKPKLTTLNSVFLQYILQFFMVFYHFLRPITVFIKEILDQTINKNRYLSKLKYSIIPLLILGVFYLIFNFANPIFQEFNASFITKIQLFFEDLPTFSLVRCLFLFVGYYFLMTIFYVKKANDSDAETPSEYIETYDENQMDNTKFQMGMLTILLVNLLLFVINFIDIKYLWFGNSTTEKLSSLVHNGTYMLIFSILLSIAIILYVFKNIHNFHPKIKNLRLLAYIWIFQNGILVVSVLLRNSKYIEQFGLTYKRIGIMIFLILTVIGLITLVVKIVQIRTFFYLLKTNLWIWYGVLIFLACLNIDLMIVQFNIKNSEKTAFDIAYAEGLSIRTAPVVIDFLKQKPGFAHDFYRNIDNHKQELTKYSWLSWNNADSDFMRNK